MDDNNMNTIQKTFTYDLPDDYLYQTNELGKTAEWTYIGPDKLWIFIDKESNLYTNRCLTDFDHGGEIPVPIDQYRICVDCNLEPLLCTLLYEKQSPHAIDPGTLDQHIEELPDGLTYQRPLNPVPDHTYELFEIMFDPNTNNAITPFPWKKPHMTWEGIRQWRNLKLDHSDDRDHEYMPESLRTEWQEYRQKLRDLPQIHGANNGDQEPTTDPWKIVAYIAPDGTS